MKKYHAASYYFGKSLGAQDRLSYAHARIPDVLYNLGLTLVAVNKPQVEAYVRVFCFFTKVSWQLAWEVFWESCNARPGWSRCWTRLAEAALQSHAALLRPLRRRLKAVLSIRPLAAAAFALPQSSFSDVDGLPFVEKVRYICFIWGKKKMLLIIFCFFFPRAKEALSHRCLSDPL